MAYCNNCGAYIPDGDTVCVACGTPVQTFGSAAQTQTAGQHSSAPSSDDLREKLEEKQRQQEEKSKEWAKQAYEDYKANSSHSTSQSTGEKPFAGQGASDSSKRTLGKVLALLSYISGFCVLPFFLTPNDQFAKYHARQGVVLFVFSILLDILSKITGVAAILNIARIYLIYKGIKNVLEDRTEELPYIGKYAKKVFGK